MKKFYLILLLLMGALIVPISFSAESLVPDNNLVGGVHTIQGGYDYLAISSGGENLLGVFGSPNQYISYDGEVSSIDGATIELYQGSFNKVYDNYTLMNGITWIELEREIEDFNSITYYYENVSVPDNSYSPYFEISSDENAIIDYLITFDCDLLYRTNNNGYISLSTETFTFTADYSTFENNGVIWLSDVISDGSQKDDDNTEFADSSRIYGHYFILNASLKIEPIFQGAPYQNYLTHVVERGVFQEPGNNPWVLLNDFSNFEVDVSNFGQELLQGLNNFLSFELIPGFSLLTLLSVIIAVPLLIYILKMFLGG